MEKIEKVIDMVDNPGRYTDEEFKAMLNDPESRKIYKTIVETRAAADMDDADLDIDKEWSNFATRHLDTAPRHTFIFGSKWNFMKIAAVFAVVLALSGASYAAYRYVKTARETAQNRIEATAGGTEKQQYAAPAETEADGNATKPAEKRTFINISLEKMLPEIASYYNVKIVFKNEEAKKLRIYYNWDSNKGMAATVKELNQFENITLSLDKDVLTVE